MAGEEGEELARIALIGLDGLGRKAPFAGNRSEPILPQPRQFIVGDNEKFVHGGSMVAEAVCSTQP